MGFPNLPIPGIWGQAINLALGTVLNTLNPGGGPNNGLPPVNAQPINMEQVLQAIQQIGPVKTGQSASVNQSQGKSFWMEPTDEAIKRNEDYNKQLFEEDRRPYNESYERELQYWNDVSNNVSNFNASLMSNASPALTAEGMGADALGVMQPTAIKPAPPMWNAPKLERAEPLKDQVGYETQSFGWSNSRNASLGSKNPKTPGVLNTIGWDPTSQMIVISKWSSDPSQTGQSYDAIKLQPRNAIPTAMRNANDAYNRNMHNNFASTVPKNYFFFDAPEGDSTRPRQSQTPISLDTVIDYSIASLYKKYTDANGQFEAYTAGSNPQYGKTFYAEIDKINNVPYARWATSAKDNMFQYQDANGVHANTPVYDKMLAYAEHVARAIMEANPNVYGKIKKGVAADAIIGTTVTPDEFYKADLEALRNMIMMRMLNPNGFNPGIGGKWDF